MGTSFRVIPAFVKEALQDRSIEDNSCKLCNPGQTEILSDERIKILCGHIEYPDPAVCPAPRNHIVLPRLSYKGLFKPPFLIINGF